MTSSIHQKEVIYSTHTYSTGTHTHWHKHDVLIKGGGVLRVTELKHLKASSRNTLIQNL